MARGRLLCRPLGPALIKYAQNKAPQPHVGDDTELEVGEKYLSGDQV